MISLPGIFMLPAKAREWSALSLILTERFDFSQAEPPVLTEKGTLRPAPR